MCVFAFEWVRFPLYISLFMLIYFFFYIKILLFFLLSSFEANTWWVSFPFMCALSVHLINNPSTHTYTVSVFFSFSLSSSSLSGDFDWLGSRRDLIYSNNECNVIYSFSFSFILCVFKLMRFFVSLTSLIQCLALNYIRYCGYFGARNVSIF